MQNGKMQFPGIFGDYYTLLDDFRLGNLIHKAPIMLFMKGDPSVCIFIFSMHCMFYFIWCAYNYKIK